MADSAAQLAVAREALSQLATHLEAARTVGKLTAESAQLAALFDKMQGCLAVASLHTQGKGTPAARADSAHVVMLERKLLEERTTRRRLEQRLQGVQPLPLRIEAYSRAPDVSEKHMDALLLKLALVDGSVYASVPSLQMDTSVSLSRSAIRRSCDALVHCRLGARYERDQDSSNLLAASGDASRDARALARCCLQHAEMVALDKAAHAYEKAADGLAGAMRRRSDIPEIDEQRRALLHATDELSRLLTPSHVKAVLEQQGKHARLDADDGSVTMSE